MSGSSEARELELVSKLELRIALAETDSRLQTLLQTYLAPLLLKLGSENTSVRNKVLALCQHLNTRIKSSQSIVLPVSALMKQFKEANVVLVRHFDLLFTGYGLDRLDNAAKLDLLPGLLHNISKLDAPDTQLSTIFMFILRLLPLFKLPPRGGSEDSKLGEKLNISPADTAFLSHWIGKLMILTLGPSNGRTCPGLSVAEYDFLNSKPQSGDWDTSAGGLSLIDTKVTALRFLASGAFHDADRFIPALIASADPNSRISEVGEDILKRFRPELESTHVVDQLFALYLGTSELEGASPARPALKIKILNFLSKSVRATAECEKIILILDDGLISEDVGGAKGLEVSKLRQQIFSFISWFVRMGSPSDLTQLAPSAIQSLKNMVVGQGWPVPIHQLKPAEINSRTLAYDCIGLLAPKVDHRSDSINPDSFVDIELLEWLFISLSSDVSDNQISVTVEQALGNILNFVAKNSNEVTRDLLRPILIRYATIEPGSIDPHFKFRAVRSTRYAAVRFSNRCLPFSDIPGRFMNFLAIADEQKGGLDIAEEGRKGLNPYWYRMLNSYNDAPGSENDPKRFELPTFTQLLRYLNESGRNRDTLQPKILSLLTDAGSISVYASIMTFLRNILLCEAFMQSNTIQDIDQDWEQRLTSILSTDESARSSLRNYLIKADNSVPDFLDRCLKGLVFHTGLPIGQSATHFIEIASLTPNEKLKSLVHAIPFLLPALFVATPPDQDTAAQIYGIIGSHPIASNDLDSWYMLSEPLSSWQAAVGQAIYTVRGALLAQTFLASRLLYRKGPIQPGDTKIQGLFQVILEILENSRDSTLRNAAFIAIGELSLSSALTFEMISNESTWKIIVNELTADAKKQNEIAISAIGKLSLILPKEDSETSLFKQLLKVLYDLHEIRVVEVQFAVGEALSVLADGWQSKALIASLDVDAPRPESNIPAQILSGVLDKITTDCKASKPSLRKAAVIWLLCLIQYCGHHNEIQTRLRQCQYIFIWLLSDRDETVQESASRGLSLVYELGTQDLKDDLVRDLVRSFTAEDSNIGGGKVTEETELFEPGALPTGDGSVTTYKDIVNLASEVGDPSLVYRFMSLASNSAIWSSRAAFGRFGLSNVLSDSNVNGYLSQNPKLYPKLYRYRFDPNTNVQKSMTDIWNSLVKDSNAVIDSNFDAIIEDLLKSMMDGKQWRVRQASCAGIASLLHGRAIEKYDKYLQEILTKTFKVLDDIKLSVRQEAFALCRTLSEIVLRALESGDASSKRATLMLKHIVPFLLGREGLDSGVEEVQAYSIVTITQIIKKAHGQLLRPFIPQIIEKFLTAMSSVEPQTINYIHLNAEKYGVTGQQIDKMRLSAIRSSPMMEAMELHLLDSLDEASIKEVAPVLEGSLRSAIGLPSKVGCSRVLVILSSKSLLFRPYAYRFIRLLRKLVLDRNETVSASYSSAIGYLTRLCSDDEVIDTIEFAKSMYLDAEDIPHRIVGGEIVNSISKLANDRVQAVASVFLPFVFLGMHDTNDEVKDFFDKTWKDNVTGPRIISLYLTEILDLLSNNLESARWPIKHASALSVATVVMSRDKQIDSSTAGAIWPYLEKALVGKTWEKKEKVLEAFVEFSIRAKTFLDENENIRSQMKTIAIREAKRNNVDYRPHGLREFGRFNRHQEGLDMMSKVVEVTAPIIEELVDESKDKMEIDSKDNHATRVEDKTLTAAVECILQSLNPSVSQQSLIEYLVQVTPLVEKAIIHGGKHVYPVLYDGLNTVFERLNEQLTKEHDQPQSQSESPLQPSAEFNTALLAFANKLLFCEVELTIESTRNKRAQATVLFAKACKQLSNPSKTTHIETINEWKARERSEQVLVLLNEAISEM
ncbi:proteasome component M29 [Myotisia sp. PD_48]|nr:proteasome component M29 [Myotisia sp. PD_48]